MKRIVFTGGGTAGHIMPNIALIEELKNEFDCVYVGGDGMERELCAARGIPFYAIRSVKLRRDAFIKNAAVPFVLASCVRGAKRLLREIKPQLIFSKGGYVALPAVLSARPLGIKLICHESDCSPGLVTKLSRRRAQRILCAFEPCARMIKGAETVGSPIRREIFDATPNKYIESKLTGGKPRLLVVGGSSGAASLNGEIIAALPRILSRFDIIHITGKNKTAAVNARGYLPIEFCDDMGGVYAISDMVVSRAGANALAELIALGIPTLAVPLEKASRGDQLKNALYYESMGAICTYKESDGGDIADAILSAYNKRTELAAAMRTLHVNGTATVCGVIRDCLAD